LNYKIYQLNPTIPTHSLLKGYPARRPYYRMSYFLAQL